MDATWIKPLIILTLISLAIVADLRTKKVTNTHNLVNFIVAIFVGLSLSGLSSLPLMGASLITAFLISSPLFMLKILGGGDIKLLLALSPLLSWNQVIGVLVTSLIWGSLLGVFQIILKGHFKVLISNLTNIALLKSKHTVELHKIPYTVAILFGYLTVYSLEQRGVSWL